MYWFIIPAMSPNRQILEGGRIQPKVELFSEAFAKLHISPQIDFHSEYNQKMIHWGSQDYMRIQTMQAMY